MKKVLGITLGIMTALGGFVDLGQIVFTTQAGSLFKYQLLWAIMLGDRRHHRLHGNVRQGRGSGEGAGFRGRAHTSRLALGLVTLVASNLLNLITCAAELGGIAIVLHLLTAWPEKLLLVGATVAFAAMILLSRFQWIERTLGLSGLMMIVFAASAVVLHPDWH